jgi:hypothetical protein
MNTRTTGEVLRDHGEKEVERIVWRAVKACGLQASAEPMAKMRKSDVRKVALATLSRERTSVSNSWIATGLGMEHPGSASRLLGACWESGEVVSTLNQLTIALDEA